MFLIWHLKTKKRVAQAVAVPIRLSTNAINWVISNKILQDKILLNLISFYLLKPPCVMFFIWHLKTRKRVYRQSPCSRCAVEVPIRPSTHTIGSLRAVSCAVTVQSPCSRHFVAVQSLCSHQAVAEQWLASHLASARQSSSSHRQSLCSRRADDMGLCSLMKMRGSSTIKRGLCLYCCRGQRINNRG